jgi:hypothetical protein
MTAQWQSIVMLTVTYKPPYAECRYAECRGALNPAKFHFFAIDKIFEPSSILSAPSSTFGQCHKTFLL